MVVRGKYSRIFIQWEGNKTIITLLLRRRGREEKEWEREEKGKNKRSDASTRRAVVNKFFEWTNNFPLPLKF